MIQQNWWRLIFPPTPLCSLYRSALLECSSMAITCRCLFRSIASTWCVHRRHCLLPAPPIWSVPGPWTCVVLCMVLGPVCAIFFIHCVTDCRHHNQSFIQGQHCFLPGELWYTMLSWRFGWIFFATVKSIQNNWRRWRWGPGSGRSWLSALIVHRSAYNAFWPFSLQFFCWPPILMLRWYGKMGARLKLSFYDCIK